MRLLRTITFFCSLFLIQAPAHAALELLLTQGVDSAMPVAVVPFSGQEDSQSPNNISAVIHNDLQNSGRFKVLATGSMSSFPHTPAEVNAASWHKLGVDNIVVGRVQALSNDKFKVSFALLNTFGENNKQKILTQQEFTVPASALRRLAHRISDIIYQELVGVKGIFSTRIAYVLEQHPAGQPARYQLMVADADGYNPRTILTSSEPLMSPTWSHDGKRIAYVSFEDRRSQIFISTVATGDRTKVCGYPGINGAPAWSPDDRKLAVALSKDGNLNIYIIDLASGQSRQLTHDKSITTEPVWAPDGRSIVFTSDRDGSPQLYRHQLSNNEEERITFSGSYNARASFTPDGKEIVLLHRDKGMMYNIAIQDLRTGTLEVLTRSGRDESPSLSANGNMILYGTEAGELGVVSTDGRISLRIPGQDGAIQGPAWSPFLM